MYKYNLLYTLNINQHVFTLQSGKSLRKEDYIIMNSTGYAKLEKNLVDIIEEQQIKLGYCREDVRLYYPLSSLNHFFGTTDDA